MRGMNRLTALLFAPFALFALGSLLAACNLNSPATAATPVPASSRSIRLSAQTSPTPVPDHLMQQVLPTPSAPPGSSAAAAPYSCAADDADGADAGGLPARRIAAVVAVDFASKAAEVEQRIAFVNQEAAALEMLVLDVQANQWADSFWLDALAVNGRADAYELAANRLQVALAEPLPAGCQLEIALRFRLQPQAIRDGLRAYRGFFGYSPRQLNLAHFLPTVAARLNGEWRIHEPAGIGEQIVYELADWDVQVKVANAADSLRLAAPGAVTEIAPAHWRVELHNARDFAISLSESFRVEERELAGGMTVVVYAFADAAGALGGGSAAHAMTETVKALQLFERLFGDYAYRRFVLVQGDFPDGMEFSGLVFVGTAWFDNFDGTPFNYLTLISVHEVAHQWWYARVGSDSALHPWLDEAFATYSEYLFIEAYYPNQRDWWWTFRVAGFLPQGAVDSTVYEFATPREYINAIYLRGVQMLHNLREDIEDEAFFALLQEYARAGDGRIAEPTLFWSQLSAQQVQLSQQTRNDFLRDPNVALLSPDAPDSTAEQG